MSDDLDDLRRALKAVPAPDGEAKARAMALAMENFERLNDPLQGSTDPARSSEDRQGAAPLNGVRRMFHYLTSRPALAATTSVAALLIGVAVILPVADLRIGKPTVVVETREAPVLQNSEPAATSDAAPATTSAPLGGEGAALTEEAETQGAPETAQVPGAKVAADNLARTAESDAASSVTGAEPLVEAPMAEMEALPVSPVVGLADTEMRLRTEAPAAGLTGYVAAPDAFPTPVENTEAYSNEAPNPVKVTAEEPVSTFSIDVDTASYAVVRSSLTGGTLPTPDQVRIEEMVNYFPYAYAAPEGDAAFASTVSVMPTPWNPGTRLVTIGIQGALPEVAARPPLNLVFLIDTSGSMEDANKLPLLKQSLSLMLSELRPEDQVSIVTYAGSAGVVLPPVQAADRAAILSALENLAAGGSTAGAEGLALAYQVAEGMKAEGEVTRILLATDGDFNVGVSDPDGLEAYVAKKRETGTYLSVLGFGRGNLDDAVMQALAQNGNGQAAYIDTLSEARKVLVDQLTGALFPIADDVKIQVEWSPATVAEYRLIGYETRALRREDFNNDKVDAGEIGAGTQVTAIYEVTAPGSDALLNDPLRYGSAAATEGSDGELGFLRLRWKAPGEAVSTLVETPITGTEGASAETRFAAAVAGFGQLLQGSVYLGDWGWDQAIELAVQNRGEDAFGYRIEAVTLMRLAQSLSQ
ncbi:MAG: von Willebrand factor type A domain-containing protein [Tabrizicola sp.]|nr:von Willebrand factor type A domain-containing protein [Tabrizicola sp.]MDP3195507.1 von Willebrand factor type A domain-containing protein [Tabrizicola sp.]